MPTNNFYNAIQQLRAQKVQRDTPKAQVTAAPVQTPELDKATGNAGASASKVAMPGLQINPNWQQTQQTEKQQSRTSKYGRTHSKRTSTEADDLAGDTAGTNSRSPASATGKYDPDSTKATGISNGVPVLTSYDGFKRLDQGISNNTGRTQSQPKRLEMNGKAVSPMLPKYREIVNSGNTEQEIARLEQQLSDLDEQWTAQWQGAMRGVNVNGMTREEYDRQRNAILSDLDVLGKAENGTLGQRTGAFLKGITGGNMSMEEYKDLPEGVQRAFMRGADIKDAPLMAQIALDNALAKFGNTEAGTVSVSPTDPESYQTAARVGQMTGLAAGAGIQNAAAGTARAVQMVEDLVNLPHGPITERIIADRDGIAAKIEDETANWTDKQREYYNYAIEAFRMLPSMATAWATAGGSTVAQAGSQIAAQAAPWTKAVTDFASGFLTNPVFYSTALEVTGNGYEQALAKGADEKHAALYAITNGVLNAMLEVGGAQELPSKIKNKGFQNAFLEYIKSIPEEGLEEVEQGIVEQLLGSVQLGEDNKIVSITDPEAILSFTRAVQEFKGGGVLSSIMGGGSLAINASTGAYRNNPRAERDQQMQESLTPIAAAVLGDQQATTMDRGETQTVSAGDNRVELEQEELPTAEGRPQPRPTEDGGTIERGEMPGRQETDQREPTPGTNPRADEQAQLEEALNTPQAPESAKTTEGQAGTSPIADAILQQQREQENWLDRVEEDEARDNPQEGNVPSQLNIDNAANPEYNNVMGGVTNNDGTGSIEDSGNGMGGLQGRLGSGDQGGNASEQSSRDSGIVRLSDDTIRAFSQRGIVPFELHSGANDLAAFSASLDAARAEDQANGWAVTPKSVEDLNGINTILSNDNKAGLGVAQDGDIEAVFKNKNGGPKSALNVLIPAALEQGGTKLDCYGEGLARLYARYGFVPVAQVDFNEEYANDGWTPDKGKPQIYFMMHNGDSAATVAEKAGTYHIPTDEELHALPRFNQDSYDVAYSYRDNLLSQQQNDQNDNQPPAPPAPPQTPPAQTPGTQQTGTNPFQNQEQNQQGGRTGIQPVDRGAGQNGDLTGAKVSQTAQTVQGAKPTTKDFAALMGREMENGAYRYFPITNDESVNRAIETITDKGWDKALFDWEKDVYKGVAGDQMTSIGALLYNNAVNSGNTALASEILSYYVSLGRSTARGLQAFRILKDMDPSTRLYGMLGGVREMSEKYTHDPDAIQIDSDMAERYRTAATEEERDAVFDEIMDDLARQITEKRAWDVSVKEMWTALRYLNMLGNLRTQARNIGGNTAAAAAFTAKYYVQNALERIAKKARHGAYQANTAVNVGEYMDAARQDAKAMEDYVLGEQKYGDTQSPTSELTRRAEDKHRIFAINTKSEKLNKAVNTLLWVPEGHRLGTQWAMNKGDTLFSLPRYARALAGYVKAHGMDAATFSGIINGTIEATTEQSRMLDDARAFATKEAQEATFRDTNKLSSWVSKVGRRKDTWSPIKILSEGTSPFRKTPVNVAIRAEEFSPLGWFNTLVLEAERRLGKGNVQLSDVLNSASKSLTGTGIFLLGMLLRKLKWITGSEDDDKQKKFNELQGWQEWALNLPNGKNITIDWSTPNSIPLFMGAALMDAIDENGFNLDAFKDAIPGISQVMLKQSMLQGINDALNTVKRDYNSNNAIEPLVVQGALSYLFQGITSTLGGQLERITEDRRYTTWRDPESKGTWGTLKYQLDRATAKIPGLDRNQIEYVDAWGRPEYTGTLGERAFENAISPGYSSKYDSTEVDDELQRLYDAGMSNVFPQTTAASEKIPTYDGHGRKDGERYMTADELVRYQKVRGQTSLEMVKDLMDSNIYDSMTDEARAAAISEIYSYAKHEAARAVEKSVPNSYGDITRTSNPAAYIGMQKAFSTATSDKYSRDYDAVDDLMQQYGKMPMDVRKLLGEKVDNLGKVYTASQAGINSRTFYTAKDAVNGMSADKDANGNSISGSLKAKVVAYVDSMRLTPSQKDTLFSLLGSYTLKDVPWH